MKTYVVTIPIAGHATCEVNAESEEEAIEAGMCMDAKDCEINWEYLTAFHTGNVCHCPNPWKATAEEV